MTLKLGLSIGVLALATTAFEAQASTLTVGSLTVEDTAYIDTATLVQGTLVGGLNSVDNMLGENFGSTSIFFTNLRQNGTDPAEVVEVGFTDNTLGNDAGADFVIWEASIPQIPQISLTLDGPALLGTYLENPLIPGSTSRMHAYTFDLADLGLADGEQVSTLFITPSAGAAGIQVIGAAALNPGMAPLPAIPLPAGGGLLLTGLGVLALLRRKGAVRA